MSRSGARGDQALVAYVHHRFPSLTGTFVHREVRAVREAGIGVVNIACRRPRADEVHGEARDLVEETIYLPGRGSPMLYAAAAASFVRAPMRFWGAARRVLTGRYRRRRRWSVLRSVLVMVRGGCLARMLGRLGEVRHVHAPFSTEVASVAWMAARLSGLTFSFTSHTAFDARLLREKLRDASFAVAISDFDRRKLLREAGGEGAEKVHVVHCGAGVAPTGARAPRGVVPLVLSVGSLIEKKGHAYLIRACALLKAREASFTCRIVGGGPLADELREEIRVRGLNDCVRLLGPRDQGEVRSLYAGARVFVLASHYAVNGDLDGIPVVLMEAMAAGVPCVSTRVSGIPELIEDGKEGILIEEKEVEALADAIERLLGDEALCARVSRAARAKVEREFNVERSAARLAELFRGAGRAGGARTDGRAGGASERTVRRIGP